MLGMHDLQPLEARSDLAPGALLAALLGTLRDGQRHILGALCSPQQDGAGATCKPPPNIEMH